MSAQTRHGRTPVIHIGMPKTATKTLQWHLFANHSEIYYLGRFDGQIFQEQYRKFNFCRNRSVQDVMEQVAYKGGFCKPRLVRSFMKKASYKGIFTPNIPECREKLNSELQYSLENNLLPVWSWESYSTDGFEQRKARAENLARLFGQAKIIITLRNPIALLESAYFLILRRNNIGGRGLRGRPPCYWSIDKWLEKHLHGEVMPHLEYAQTIRTYIELFGKENVHVFLFENLVADQARFIQGICSAMGIDAAEGLSLIGKNKDNTRWTDLQIETLKKIQKSVPGTLKFMMAGKLLRREMLKLDQSGRPGETAPKACAPIPEAWQERIFEITYEGNRWLAESFKLPLDKYGYFG